MTKREKELQRLRNQIARMEASREAAIKMLVRATLELPKLRKSEARLETVLAKRQKPTITDEMIRTELLPGLMAVERKPAPEDDDVPAFLDRTKDEEARAEIEADQAAQKKAKTERRLAKLKIGQEIKQAELTGQRRKMPLTGKEALAAIRAER